MLVSNALDHVWKPGESPAFKVKVDGDYHFVQITLNFTRKPTPGEQTDPAQLPTSFGIAQDLRSRDTAATSDDQIFEVKGPVDVVHSGEYHLTSMDVYWMGGHHSYTEPEFHGDVNLKVENTNIAFPTVDSVTLENHK